MHIRSFGRLAFFVLCALALAACASLTGSGDPNVAATVNGTEIPVSEVEQRFEQAKSQPQVAQQLESDTEGAFESQIQAQILSQLVVTQLLDEWASDLGIEAEPEEISSERDALIEQLGGQEAFDQAVEQSGLSESDVNEQIRARVLQNEISAEVGGDTEPTDAEIEKFYETNKDARYGPKATARHILVEKKAKADEIMAKLRDGGDFAKLAKENSTDPGSAQKGGELPEFGPGQMVPEFDAAVFAADKGELVGPVKTEFGYHIIEVLDKKPGQELDEVREEIAAELAETQSGTAVQDALATRTKEAEVTVNPRFGTWNPETAQVEPEKPLGTTSEGASELPGGSEVPVPPTEAATE